MPDEGGVFDDLIEEYYRVWCRYHPAEALAAGDLRVHGLLPALGDDEFGALQSWLESFMVGVGELDTEALDTERRLDLEIAFGAALIEHHDLLEHDWRHRDPLSFLPLRPLIPRLAATPPEGRGALLERILPDVPPLVRQARAHLGRFGPLVPSLLVEAAIDEGGRLLAWLDDLRSGGCTRLEALPALPQLLEEAREAVRGYQRFLAREMAPVAEGMPGCGGARFERVMRHRHGCTLPMETLRTRLARWRAGHPLPAEGAPPGGAALPAARQLDACREILAQQQRLAGQLAWLPSVDGAPKGVAWPGVPLAVGRVDAVLWLGGEAVTPARLKSLCLDQGPLGGFLLWRMAGQTALSWPRRLFPAAAAENAWGLFMRSRLLASGYLDGSDSRLHAWRLAQALEEAQIDLDIHLGGERAEAGLQRLRRAGWDEAGARQRLVVIVRRPGEATAAVLGWRMLAALADGPDAEVGDRLRRVVQAGPVALPLVMRHVFGREAVTAMLEEAGA